MLVEKPITDNTEQAKSLVDLAHNKNLVLQVGHIERFNPALQALGEKLTRPRFIEAHRLSTYPGRSTDIGVVLDLMIHDIEVVLHLVRSPIVSIDSVGTAVLSKGEDIANARIRFESGCVANLTTSRISFEKMRKIRVFQDDAYLSLDYFDQSGVIYRKVNAQIVKENIKVEKDEPLKLELSAFVDCVRSRHSPRVGSSGRCGFGYCHAGYRTDRTAKCATGLMQATVVPAMRAPESSLSDRPLTLLIVAGEASGDATARNSSARSSGSSRGSASLARAGPRMAAAGQEQLFDMSAHAVLGLTEVLRHYFKFRGFRNRLLRLAKRERPDAVVLIDCSGFNLRLTPQLRRRSPGSRIIYYISPQVWASRSGRVKAMQRNIDLLLSILPFEKAWYAKAAPNFNVQWVGHPVLDRIRKVEEIEPHPNWVALLPGSRRTEVSTHLPVLWEGRPADGTTKARSQIHPAFAE